MARQDLTPTPARSRGQGARVLFVSYDGLTDPLGRSQILPYLTGLSRLGHEITVLTCEKAHRLAEGTEAVGAICENAGIRWIALKYHWRPPVVSSLYDLWRLMARAAKLHRSSAFNLLHCRSYLPGLVGLRLKRRRDVAFIFDMRGFWVEERTEAGDWDLRNPIFRAVYRFFKRAEGRLLAEADKVISLTRAGAAQIAVMQPEASVEVVPCCVDFAHFPVVADKRRAEVRMGLGIAPDTSVLLYLGSLGGNHLLDEMLDFFVEYRSLHPGAVFLFVTHTPRNVIDGAAAARNISHQEILVQSATREEVPHLIAAADIGVAFKRAAYSSLACSPTKLGEMLAEGVPVVANAGVGDVAEILGSSDGGVAVNELTPAAYRRAIAAIEAKTVGREALRRSALAWFDLNDGIAAYDAVYRSLLSQAAPKEIASPDMHCPPQPVLQPRQ